MGASGAPLQPFRDARPLLQEITVPCGSGLASRKGRKAAPCRQISTGPGPAPRRCRPAVPAPWRPLRQ
ncbi:hypothetical protein E6B08_17935 [Pseudomonas putida]|uniref:Uncharacterized protein n=1 Tax=Pseudomonas putida TaxID=303 RepID=A0A4D6X8X8_PSEPU|nr:hypothetical protein E6B08_17935 [Pseudomonas putida]